MIAFLGLWLFIVVSCVVLFLVTQVAIPISKDIPLFPMFRKSEIDPLIEKVDEELDKTSELLELKRKTDKLKRRKAELEGK